MLSTKSNFVTYNHLLFITGIVVLSIGIFLYSMLKHAIELRQRTTQVIEDLTLVQTYIDVELAASLAAQDLSIYEARWNLNVIKNFNPGLNYFGWIPLT